MAIRLVRPSTHPVVCSDEVFAHQDGIVSIGSEKEPEGMERKGGGKGREGLLANKAYPVSK
ncbi:MAG: hypothetical protein Q9197_003361 [Variospora fuerteventurae]